MAPASGLQTWVDDAEVGLSKSSSPHLMILVYRFSPVLSICAQLSKELKGNLCLLAYCQRLQKLV